MSNIASYSTMLAADLRKLPDLSFADKSPELQVQAEALQDAVIASCNPAKLANPDTRVEELLSAYDRLKASGLYDSLFSAMNDTANMLAQGINKSYTILSEEIAEKVEEIEEDVDRNIAADTEDQVEEDSEAGDNVAASMHTLDWAMYINSLGGYEFLVNNYKDKYNYPTNNFSDISYACHKGKMAITSLNQNNELRDELAKSVGKACGDDEIAKFNLMSVMKLATDPYAFNEAVYNLNALADSPAVGKHVAKVCAMIDAIRDVLPIAMRCKPNVSAQTRETLAANLQKVNDLLLLSGYALIPTRKYFANSLMMTANLINGDNYDDYINQGGTLVDAHNYMRVFCKSRNDIDVPAQGISGKAILSKTPELKAKFAERKQELNRKRMRAELSTSSRAVQHALVSYLDSVDDTHLPANMTRKEFMDFNTGRAIRVGDRLDASPDENRNNLLYNFVLDTHYAGTFVSDLHHRLSEAVVKEATAGDAADIDDTAKDDIISNIGSEVASEFAVKNLVE